MFEEIVGTSPALRLALIRLRELCCNPASLDPLGVVRP